MDPEGEKWDMKNSRFSENQFEKDLYQGEMFTENEFEIFS